MTTTISILTIAGLAMLLAAAASGLAASLLAPRAVVASPDGTASASHASEGLSTLARVAHWALVAALALLAAALAVRGVVAGRAPWSNLHEFSLAFAVALVGAHAVLARRARRRAPRSAAFALSLDDRIDPLVPALQQPLLLTVHVGSAALAYAMAALAFVAAAAELGQRAASDGIRALPSAATLRAVGHRLVLLAFPILTIAIVLGSVWANLAWRSYWSNDPKELAAAATWAVFAAYLHVAGRRDRLERLAPWLIVLGFAGVLFTYIGAGLFFVGEHSYAAP
jgi:ABC-type transport system involved in cytochrome c biogenesis permease subunit